MPKPPNHFHSFWKNLTNAQLVHKLEERMSRWYTFKEISIQLGIPVKSIYFYHERGDGPRVHKFGRHLRVLDEVVPWIKDAMSKGLI